MTATPVPTHWTDRAVLSVAEAGELLGLSRSAAYRSARDGFIPTIKVSRTMRRVPVAALKALLASAGAE